MLADPAGPAHIRQDKRMFFKQIPPTPSAGARQNDNGGHWPPSRYPIRQNRKRLTAFVKNFQIAGAFLPFTHRFGVIVAQGVEVIQIGLVHVGGDVVAIED